MACPLSLRLTAAPLAATATRAAGCGTSTGVRCVYVRTGYSTCVIVRLNLGGFPSARLCPLDPVLSWDGLGRPWDGMHPCRVTRWPGPGSQRRSVAGLQSGRARVGGVCHHRASSVGCLYPMPGLLGLLGLLAVACWPARPRAARCLGPSPIQKTEYAIGLPYSQPSQSRLQRPSRPHLARFCRFGFLLLCRNKPS